MTSILLSSIIEGTRGRQKKNYGNLDGLKASLQSIGSIHPITLAKRPDGRFDLVAGGRRFEAMRQLGVKELFHGSVLDPNRLGFVFADEVPEDVLREAELDENLHRLDVDWIDNCMMICNVHELKKAKSLKWGAAQTSALLGTGFGPTKVSYAVLIGPLLRSGDKELLACSSFRDAISVMTKRSEDVAMAELQRRASAKLAAGASPIVRIDLGSLTGASPTGTGSFLDVLNTSLGPKIDFTAKQVQDIAAKLPDTLSERKNGTEQLVQQVSIPLSQMFRLGDCLRGPTPIMQSLPDACFDHIVTDIPYGIDMDNLTDKGKADVAAEHEVEANVELMPLFLEQAFRLVKPRGFCVFFMDAEHFTFLLNTAKKIGWHTQDWMLVWLKTHPCQNQAAAYNYTKTYETAMVLRKDSQTVLRKQRPNAHWIGDGAAERKLYNNKFAKPFLLWKELIYDNIAFPGQSIFDPFAGECSSLRAALNCGLVPFGCEVSPTHYNRGVENLKSVYALIHQSNVQFV